MSKKETLEELEDRIDLEMAQIALKKGEFVDWDDFKKELDL